MDDSLQVTRSSRARRLERRVATASASVLVLGTALMALAGCPGGKEDGSGGSTSITGTDTMPPGDTTTSPPPGDTTTTGVGQTGGSESGSDSVGPDTEGPTTGGEDVCEIMLPPPPMCPAAGQPEPPVLKVYTQDRRQPGFEPVDGAGAGYASPDDPVDGPVGFIMEPDGAVDPFECDIFAQDCGPGEKCMPWANDGGGSWNATRCSPIAAMPDAIGESCTVEGSGVSGVDSCEAGSMCWDVDARTGEGTCVEMCSCSPATPICNTPNTVCSISNMGVLVLCLPICNPLDTSTCGPGEGCYPSGDLFQCAPDASGGMGVAGDPCEFLNVCDPGHICLSAGQVPGCAGAAGCCSPYCVIGDASGCLPGQECVPYYAGGMAPDECLGMTGVCSTPL